MKTDWRVEVAQLILLAAMFVLAALTWPSAPDQIPVHWNIEGQVDRYGGKFEGLLAVPLLATGMYLLLRFAPRIDPGRANYPAFRSTYQVVRVGALLVLAAVYGLLHLALRGREIDISTIVPMLVGALFIVIGATMGKLRPNWFIGIRTPWTLSSKTAWARTHRLGGWLFILHGVLLMTAFPLLDSRVALRVLVVGVAAIVAWSLIYSYLVWRRDPDKVPPAGSIPAE